MDQDGDQRRVEYGLFRLRQC